MNSAFGGNIWFLQTLHKKANINDMLKAICTSAIIFITLSTLAQNRPDINDALNKFGLREQKVFSGSDTITYYLKSYSTKPDKLVVFIQGTDPYPVFFYQIKNNRTVDLLKSFNDDYKTLDSTYTYAIIAKPGLSGIFNRTGFSVPERYHKNNYREYRVTQLSLAIADIKQHHLKNPKAIIVYGHSEGAQIAAALATVNKDITHLGFWSGNVLNNFYEFTLFERIAVLKSQQTDSTAHANINALINRYRDLLKDPNSTAVDDMGYTNRRWSSYQEAPINNLLKINIPIFAAFATGDESTPVETAYLLPIQFIQHRKDNLTFEMCMNCDHSYREKKDGKTINHWNDIFRKFIQWAK